MSYFLFMIVLWGNILCKPQTHHTQYFESTHIQHVELKTCPDVAILSKKSDFNDRGKALGFISDKSLFNEARLENSTDTKSTFYFDAFYPRASPRIGKLKFELQPERRPSRLCRRADRPVFPIKHASPKIISTVMRVFG